MSGVIVAMRRSLLSCTSLARNGLAGLGATLVAIAPAQASDLPLCMGSRPSSSNVRKSRPRDGAGAARLFGGGGYPADAHARPRCKKRARLRSDIGDLQVQADRLRALLFAEPQVLISWAAGDNRRKSAATLRF